MLRNTMQHHAKGQQLSASCPQATIKAITNTHLDLLVCPAYMKMQDTIQNLEGHALLMVLEGSQGAIVPKGNSDAVPTAAAGLPLFLRL